MGLGKEVVRNILKLITFMTVITGLGFRKPGETVRIG